MLESALHHEVGSFRTALDVSNIADERYVAACPSAGTCYVANLRRATFNLGYRL